MAAAKKDRQDIVNHLLDIQKACTKENLMKTKARLAFLLINKKLTKSEIIECTGIIASRRESYGRRNKNKRKELREREPFSQEEFTSQNGKE